MNSINSSTKLYTDVSCMQITQRPQMEISLDDLHKITSDMTLEEFRNTHPDRDCYEKRMKDVAILGMYLISAAKCYNFGLTEFFIKELFTFDIGTARNFFYSALSSVIQLRAAIIQIHGKCGDSSLQMIGQLLEAGADVNIPYCEEPPDGFPSSFLHLALEFPDLALTKLLLKHGAQKFYLFNRDTKELIKQKFTDSENQIYKQAKKELRDEQISLIWGKVNMFILGLQDPNATHNCFHADIVSHIFNSGIWNVSGRAVSSNQKLIDEAKKLIAENQEMVIGNEGRILMLANRVIL